MSQISIWLVGSIVPLAVALATFSVLYFIKYKQYLLEKNNYADCQFLNDLAKGYLFARIAHSKIMQTKFWWYFFGNRYIDLVNFNCERFIYELDKLDHFEESQENSPIFMRTSFLGQWKGIHHVLFTTGYSDGRQPFKIHEKFGEDPFGWMSIVIASKLHELYKKHALHVLRTQGYYEFDKFICKYYGKSQNYPHNIPFSAIHREITTNIIREHSQEIGERIRHEMNEIIKGNKVLKEQQFVALRELVNTSIASNKEGDYYPGISDIRREIYALLEKEKKILQ